MTAEAAVYFIDENNCIECGQCRRYCPIAGAIRIDERYQHVVVADNCSGCGLCEAFCPVPGALVRLPVEQKTRRVVALRRVAWRKQWGYHNHPLMGGVTSAARSALRSIQQSERLSSRTYELTGAN